ncbi:MAG: hypothetical protein LBN01_04595 [Endomicrobium sp.]|jgi:hypothetical protein|nr:hypothetical protein [Endomicrobium sp.]
MWSEISAELRGKILEERLENVKEESFIKNELVDDVPNEYFFQRFES